jgi:hypothetical protein
MRNIHYRNRTNCQDYLHGAVAAINHHIMGDKCKGKDFLQVREAQLTENLPHNISG